MPLAKPTGIITLLSDLGLDDPAIGILKGEILSRFLDAKIVDLCHRGPPASAGTFLAEAHAAFPAGTVHLVALREGAEIQVGEAGGHYFVAPRAALSEVLALHPGADLRKLDGSRLGIAQGSETPLWRRLEGPAAAEIASGRFWISELGAPSA